MAKEPLDQPLVGCDRARGVSICGWAWGRGLWQDWGQKSCFRGLSRRSDGALLELLVLRTAGKEARGSHGATASPCSLLGQVVQTAVDLQLWTDRDSPVHFGLDDVPLLTWLLGCLSLVLVVVTNEVVKLHEIR